MTCAPGVAVCTVLVRRLCSCTECNRKHMHEPDRIWWLTLAWECRMIVGLMSADAANIARLTAPLLKPLSVKRGVVPHG